jgi:DNA-binding NarL/FixJ family response regulator
MAYRIMIVEDHNLLREGLRSMISAIPGFEVVGDARDGQEAVRNALALKPDLITMDLSMPNMNGIEATLQIKRRDPRVRIVALTAHKSEEYVREMLKAGADGYVLKDTTYEELVTALRSVLGGKMFLSPEVSGQVVNSYLSGDTADKPHNPWELTSRERSIARLVAEGRTNRTAAEVLHVSPKTVEKHRASLMHKLGLRSATELVLMALQEGWVEHGQMVRFSPSRLPHRDGGPSQFQDTMPFMSDEVAR